MKTFRLVMALMIVSVTASLGQNLKGTYYSKPQDNGTLYYIMPLEMFSHPQNGAIPVDFTHLTGTGEIRITFTFSNPEPVNLSGISFGADDKKQIFEVEKYYIQPEKSTWSHRYSAIIPLPLAEHVFSPDNADNFYLFTENYDDAIIFKAKNNSWKKNSQILQKIFTILSHNQ